jgi:5-methylcytosine-specific restriction endonuclease McrA
MDLDDHGSHKRSDSWPRSFAKRRQDLSSKSRSCQNAEIGTKKELVERDGWNCRFCGMELICRSTLNRVRKAYPGEANWQDTEARKHALLRIMAVQFDHITPHCRGGQTVLDNLVITCAPCNYGRSSWTLEESRLIDPRTRPIVRTDWDGLAGKFLPVQDLRQE